MPPSHAYENASTTASGTLLMSANPVRLLILSIHRARTPSLNSDVGSN